MGRVGSALDNAAAESWNSTLEHELLSRRHFATKDHARREVARFIDAYNHRRRHSSCEMLPPVAYEQLLAHGLLRQLNRAKPHETRLSDRLTAPDPPRVASGCGRMTGFNPNQEPSTVPGEAH
jgi:hypothetical protein